MNHTLNLGFGNTYLLMFQGPNTTRLVFDGPDVPNFDGVVH